MILGIGILLCLGSHYVATALMYASMPHRIPIGALLDMEIPQAKTGFMYQFDKHNNSSGLLKLDRYEKEINASDPYDFKRKMCSIMSNGVFAFVGFANASTLSTIQSYASYFHMPFVTASPLTNDTDIGQSPTSNYILRMRPLYDRAILDVIREYKWDRVYYLYDSHEDLQRMQSMFQYVNSRGMKVEIEVIMISDPLNCYALLRNLDKRDPGGDKYIILDLSTLAALKAVLNQILNVGMNRDKYHYVLGGLVIDELDLTHFQHGGVNITGFRLLNRDSPKIRAIEREWLRLSRANPVYWKEASSDQSIHLDSALTMDAVNVIVTGLNSMLHLDAKVFKNIFRRARPYSNGTPGVPCNEPAPWTLGPDIMNSFKNVNFEGITGHIAFDEYGFRKDYQLDVIELFLNTGPRKMGTWDSEEGLRMDMSPVHKLPPSSKNTTKIVTTIENPPYLIIKKDPEDGEPLVGNARYEGYCVDLIEKISKVVGFDYVIHLVKDGIFGAHVMGEWNGMVGELTRKEAHLAVAPLTISSKRQRVIDFSKPFMNLGISIMIKKPEKQKPGVFSFMDPLSSQIWMCIVFSYVGVSVVLFLVSRFSPYEWQIEDSVNGPTFTNDFTILNSLWFSLGAFMRQGCGISPRSMSGRIVGSAWWFFTLIIISSYTANLAAFLTVERMLTPIESADDLVKQTEIQYGTLDSGSTQSFFETSHIAVYSRMWNFMSQAEPSVFVKSTLKGVEKVRTSKGKYAFLLESTMNDYHNQKKPCNTMKVGTNLDSKGYGIATPRKSELKIPINLAVLRLRENGELQKLQKKWWYDKGECNADDGKGSSQSALTLSNVAGIFYILIGGLGLSMIISLLEFLYKSRMESRRQQKYAATFRSKTRLSVRGTPERENGGYSYSAPNQVISLDGYSEYACPSYTHTEV